MTKNRSNRSNRHRSLLAIATALLVLPAAGAAASLAGPGVPVPHGLPATPGADLPRETAGLAALPARAGAAAGLALDAVRWQAVAVHDYARYLWQVGWVSGGGLGGGLGEVEEDPCAIPFTDDLGNEVDRCPDYIPPLFPGYGACTKLGWVTNHPPSSQDLWCILPDTSNVVSPSDASCQPALDILSPWYPSLFTATYWKKSAPPRASHYDLTWEILDGSGNVHKTGTLTFYSTTKYEHWQTSQPFPTALDLVGLSGGKCYEFRFSGSDSGGHAWNPVDPFGDSTWFGMVYKP